MHETKRAYLITAYEGDSPSTVLAKLNDRAPP